MTSSTRILFAGIAIGSIALTACDTSPSASPDDGLDCTEIGCGSTITLMLPTLDPGEYQITVTMDLLTADCLFTIPMNEVTCKTSDGLYLNGNGDLYASLPIVDESELDETISVQVFHPYEDGPPYLDVDATIDWSDPYYPNGEECDEFACFMGTVLL